MKIDTKKVLGWLDNAWRIALLITGAVSVFVFIVLSLSEPWESSNIVILVFGVLLIIPFIVKKIRDSKKSQSNSDEPLSESDSTPTPLSKKEKVCRWLDNAWRISFLALAIVCLFTSLLLFLCSEKEVGFFSAIVGVTAAIPYLLKKKREKAGLFKRSQMPAGPSRRAAIKARAKRFDQELLGDIEVSSLEEEVHTCLNCGHVYQGYYCPNCGQDKRTDKIDWHQLVIGMLSDAINFDGSTIRTLYELIRRPGTALHRYLTGQHERYSNPMKFILFAGVAFTIMSMIFPSEISTEFVSNGSGIHRAYAQFAGNIMVFQCILALIIDFFPLYGAFKWTEEGKKLNKVDFYIIMLYLIGMDFWLRAIMCPLTHWHFEWNYLRWCIFFCYQFYVLKDFFKLRFWPMVGRYTLRYILYDILLSLSMIPFMVLDMLSDGTETFPILTHAVSAITGDVFNKFLIGIF